MSAASEEPRAVPSLTASAVVALSSDGRFVAIRDPAGLRLVDGVERALLDELPLEPPFAFAMAHDRLFTAAANRLACHALPSLESRTLALPFAVDEAAYFTTSPTGRAVVLAAREALVIEDDGAALSSRVVPLPPGARVAAVNDAGQVWAIAGHDLLLVDGNGATLATHSFADAETVVDAAVLSARPSLVVLLRSEASDTLLTLDSNGARLARLSLPEVTLLRVADKRMLAVVASGPRTVSAVDLRYCRSVASTDTGSDVADLACSADAASFVVAGAPTAPGEFSVRQLGYRDMFQPARAGQQELLPVEKPTPAPPATTTPPAPAPATKTTATKTTTATPRRRTPPKLESVPTTAAAAEAVGDDAPADNELGRLLQFARRLIAREKQPRRQAHAGLDALAERYTLDELDANLALLAAAPHLDPSLREELARARGDGDQLDGALALELCLGDAQASVERIDRLSDAAPLVKQGLVRLIPPPLVRAPSLAEHELVPTSRLLSALRGVDVADPVLASLSVLLPCRADDALGVVPARERDRLARLFGAAMAAGTHALVIAPSDDGRRLLRAMAATLGYAELVSVDVAMLPSEPLPLNDVLREICHEATHRELPLVVENAGAWRHDELALERLRAVLQRLPLALWATSESELRALVPVVPLRVTLPPPDAAARAEAWLHEASRRGVALAKADADEFAALPHGRAFAADALALAAALAGNANETPTLAHVRRAVAALDGGSAARDGE
jgi:hypothetical protein